MAKYTVTKTKTIILTAEVEATTFDEALVIAKANDEHGEIVRTKVEFDAELISA